MGKYCYKCEKDVDLVTDIDSNAELCPICGTVIIRSASHLPTGTVLGGFEIIDELGRGGMGIVYRARQMNLERDVALKVLADDLAQDHEFVTRFFKEARAAASLNHPNIVQVFDAGNTPEGISYFAMELIEGETLESHIENQGKLSPKKSLKVAIQIADALDYAWKSQKLTHGDIKPDNIILNKTGGAKLADLGLAKFVHEEVSEEGIMATPLYAPPEVIRGELDAIDFHADMYSFGATLYQMLAGVPPFPDNTPEIVFQQHLEETPSPLSHHNDKLSPSLVHLVEKMLKKEPLDRFKTWEDVHSALKKIKDPEVAGKVFHANAHSHEPEKEPEQESILGLAIKIFLGFAVVVVIALIAFLAIRQPADNGKKGISQPVEASPSIDDQWKSLKDSISKMTTEDAIAKVSAFIKKCANKVPQEASDSLRLLQQKANREKQLADERAKEAEEFNAAVALLIKDINGLDLESEKLPVNQLISLNKRIENIHERMDSEATHLTINEADNKIIEDAYLKTSVRIVEYRKEQRRIRKEELAKKQKLILEEENKRRKEEAERHKEQLALAKTIDSYYSAIGKFKETKKLAILKEGIENWDKNSEIVSSEYLVRADFIKKNVIPKAREILKLFQSKEEYFKGEPLPEEMCTEQIKNYKVKEINSTAIKLIYTKDKVTLGYSIPWSSIPYKKMALLIQKKLLSNDQDILEDDEKYVALAFTLLYEPESYSDIFQKMQYSLPDKGAIWKLLKKDFDIAENELNCIEKYKLLCSSLQSKNFNKAGSVLNNLLKISKNTPFYSRYCEELDKIRFELGKFNPTVSAEEFTDICLNIAEDDYSKIYNAATVIYARYGKSIDLLERDKRDALELRKEKALNSLMEESGVKKPSDNRIPFFYWVKEKEGASSAYLNIVKESRRLSMAMNLLQLAVDVDSGNWADVKNIYENITSESLIRIGEIRIVKNWLSSFLFAYGLADFQFGDGSKRDWIARMMKQLYNNNISLKRSNSMTPLIASLAFEYSLLSRKREFPLSVSSNYEYNASGMGYMGLRVGMLGMLANIERSRPNISQFWSLKKRLNRIYRIDDRFTGDFIYMEQAGALLSGNPLSKLQMKRLKSAECFFPDISAKLLLTALSIYHCKENASFNNEEKLIQELENKVTPMTVSGDLWRKLILFKMARQPYASKISKLATKKLKDLRICTTRFYPGLLMLKGGSEYFLGNFTKDETDVYLKSYLKVSSLVSDKDINDLEIVTTSSPQNIVARLFQEQQPEKAFNYGILGIMIHCKDVVIKSSIIKQIEKNEDSLCWEERYLFRQIQNWR